MYVVVLVTTSSAKEAEQIAQTLLEKRLAACINIHHVYIQDFGGGGRLSAATKL